MVPLVGKRERMQMASAEEVAINIRGFSKQMGY